jgi:hypothetical protein
VTVAGPLPVTVVALVAGGLPAAAGRVGWLVAQDGGGLPDPVGWGFDLVEGWVTDVGDSLFAEMTAFLSRWALHSAIESSNIVWSLATRGSEIDVSAQEQTYAVTQGIAVAFLVGVLWWSIGAAALKGDAGLVGRRLFIDAPKVVLGSTAMLAILATVAGVFGEIEGWVVAEVGSPAGPFEAFDVAALDQGSGVSLVVSMAVPVLAFFMILVSLGLALFLMIRSAAINLLVVFVPLAMVAQVTPYASMARLVLEKLLALFVSKTVIVLALAVAGGLFGDVPDGGNVYFDSPVVAAPGEPVVDVDEAAMEEARQQADADAFRIVGTMLAGLGVMVVAAFSPVLVFQLIPSAYHDTSPYSGSDVGGLYGGAGPGGGGFTSARRAAGRPRAALRAVTRRNRS